MALPPWNRHIDIVVPSYAGSSQYISNRPDALLNLR
jgi:hypothetical protein